MKKYKFAICDRINVCKADICPLGRHSCLAHTVCSDGINKTQGKKHTINYCAWIPREQKQSERHNEEEKQQTVISSKLLTADLQIRVNRLAKRECCNYSDGLCDRSGKECRQKKDKNLNCDWFVKAVLPLDKTLLAEINSIKTSTELKETVTENNKSNPRVRQKQCDICGKAFNSIARNTRHCPKCAEKVHNVQKAESKRKRRSMATK